MGKRLKVGKAVTFSSKVGGGVVLFSGMEAGVHPQSEGPSQVAIH